MFSRGIWCALALLLFSPSSASAVALPIASVGFNQNGVSGSIVAEPSPAGTVICLDPAAACQDVDSVVFRVNVTSGSIDEIGASVFVFAAISGVGAFDDAGVTASSGANVLGTQARYDFDSPNLTTATTSDALFVSYTGGSLSPGDAVSFSIQPAGGLIFSVNTVLVPEPGTLILVACALAGTAAYRRGMRRV